MPPETNIARRASLPLCKHVLILRDRAIVSFAVGHFSNNYWDGKKDKWNNELCITQNVTKRAQACFISSFIIMSFSFTWERKWMKTPVSRACMDCLRNTWTMSSFCLYEANYSLGREGSSKTLDVFRNWSGLCPWIPSSAVSFEDLVHALERKLTGADENHEWIGWIISSLCSRCRSWVTVQLTLCVACWPSHTQAKRNDDSG
jgi:hypothetical protein